MITPYFCNALLICHAIRITCLLLVYGNYCNRIAYLHFCRKQLSHVYAKLAGGMLGAPINKAIGAIMYGRRPGYRLPAVFSTSRRVAPRRAADSTVVRM